MSNILVPQLGESVVEARVARWLKKEGDRVETGEPVVELETEKIDLEVGADHGGVISSIKRQEGEDVKVGELLATIDESGAARSAATTPAPGGDGAGAPAAERPMAAAAPAPTSALSPPSASASDADTPRATPTARSIAKAHDVNLGSVQGSGSAGRVMKQDVQGAIARPAPPSGAPPREAPAAPAAKPVCTGKSEEIAPKSGSACRSGARRLPGASSRRSAPPRC